jgi:hypothetical protein
LTVAASIVTLAGASRGLEVVELPPPGTGDWQSFAFRNVARSTSYTAVSLDGLAAVRAESDCSASALLFPLRGVDLARTPRLSWRWRVLRGIEVADERVKAGDDFAARVYVMFQFDPARATLMQRMRRRVARVLYGDDLPGSALNFVWTSRLEVGAVWDNPFSAVSKMLAQATGAAPGWRQEDVDVAERYAALFGHAPPALLGLAIMSDTDNTCQRATALFADFRFSSRGDPPRGAGRPPIGP